MKIKHFINDFIDKDNPPTVKKTLVRKSMKLNEDLSRTKVHEWTDETSNAVYERLSIV